MQQCLPGTGKTTVCTRGSRGKTSAFQCLPAFVRLRREPSFHERKSLTTKGCNDVRPVMLDLLGHFCCSVVPRGLGVVDIVKLSGHFVAELSLRTTSSRICLAFALSVLCASETTAAARKADDEQVSVVDRRAEVSYPLQLLRHVGVLCTAFQRRKSWLVGWSSLPNGRRGPVETGTPPYSQKTEHTRPSHRDLRSLHYLIRIQRRSVNVCTMYFIDCP